MDSQLVVPLVMFHLVVEQIGSSSFEGSFPSPLALDLDLTRTLILCNLNSWEDDQVLDSKLRPVHPGTQNPFLTFLHEEPGNKYHLMSGVESHVHAKTIYFMGNRSKTDLD